MTKPNNRQYDQLKALAQTYVPEWRFSQKNPDAGSVAAMLIDDMLAQSEERFSQVLHKHKIQYLNLFDRLKEEPVESAKSYVRFTQVGGMDEPVPVPKGTRLISENEETDSELTFETTYGITTTEAELMSICTTDGETDCISRLVDSAGEAEKMNIQAFGITDDNEAEHLLLLAYDTALEEMNGISVGLHITTVNPKDFESTMELLLTSGIRYSILEAFGGEKLFDTVERRGDMIWLTAENYIPQKVEFQGAQRFVLCLRSPAPLDLRLSGCDLVFAEKDLPADEVYCSGVSEQVGRFLPFGKPMEIYAECGIENRNVLARRGAEVEMSFDLDFEMIEQKLPETETQLDYKVIMKKPVAAPQMETVDIRADYVLVEYLSDRGWKRLLPDENEAYLMNGSASGRIDIKFICPSDLADLEEAEDGYRLRMRLMRADNLYRLPCRQFCPVVQNLRFSYSYENQHLLPDVALTRNNFAEENITAAFEKRREVIPFFTHEARERAMYLGFTESPQGMPLSLYFEVENDEDAPLEYITEYLTPNGFTAMTPVDNTGGMLYSGTLLLPVGNDVTRKLLFDRDCYWLRLRLKHRSSAPLPILRSIMTNMVRVENIRTREETFFRTDETEALHIQLAEENLLNLKVYVNEEDGDPSNEENWVLWERRASIDQRGRYCDVDLAAGTISFDRHAFAAYPLKEGEAAVKAEYQSYQGAAANVPAESINSTEESLRYISSVTNPMAAYGGYDGYNEKTSTAIISNMLRTRGRAVTSQDYFDIISQVSYGVRRIKCVSGVNRKGEEDPDVITVALLIDEYDKGSHIFSSVKDTIRQKLTETSGIVPLGKTLVLSQPHFIRFSARIWIDCDDMDNAYDLQQQTIEDVKEFLDPLHGGFDHRGWEIGVLPTVKQLLAYLKMKRSGLSVARIAMSAQARGQEFTVDEELAAHIRNPFAMAVNGSHTVYVQLRGH